MNHYLHAFLWVGVLATGMYLCLSENWASRMAGTEVLLSLALASLFPVYYHAVHRIGNWLGTHERRRPRMLDLVAWWSYLLLMLYLVIVPLRE